MKKLLLILSLAFTYSLTYGQTSYGDDADGLVIEQVEVSETLQVFPNPVMDFISLNNSKGVKEIMIFNLIGSEVLSFKVAMEGDKYFVGDLRVGMYLVQIIGTNNKTLKTLRLSKK